MKDKIDCIDSGTEYCPCSLAEANECLICSNLQGKNFCDCANWNGVCIYQDFNDNGCKSKDGRKTSVCRIKSLKNSNDQLIMITVNVPHKLSLDLKKPGSYVFINTDQNHIFDVPISVFESDTMNDLLTLVIEIRGIKTKRLLALKENNDIYLRGPYWNGVFGVHDLINQKNGNVVVLSRGIGAAPAMPVIEKLIENNNNLLTYFDFADYDKYIFKNYIKEHFLEFKEYSLLEGGKLTIECKLLIENALKNNKISHIHISGADILTHNVISFLDQIHRDDISLSCCNNFKMCCGEGICGACTVRYSGRKIKRFCKLQATPRSVFEGRRYI